MSSPADFGQRSNYLRIDSDPWIGWWTEQYETPEDLFAECSFWRRGKYAIWVAAADVDPAGVDPVDGVGIPLLRIGREVWKPTSVAVIHFGGAARRNVVDLSQVETVRFLARETIEFAAGDGRGELPNRGYVIARYLGVPVGCGLWRRGTLVSSVPKGRALPDLELPAR